MKRAFFAAIATLLAIETTATFRGVGATPVTSLPRGPVVDRSLEANARSCRHRAATATSSPAKRRSTWQSSTLLCTTLPWPSKVASR